MKEGKEWMEGDTGRLMGRIEEEKEEGLGTEGRKEETEELEEE